MLEDTTPKSEPTKRNWVKDLDLNRTTLTKSFVDRMESCMREAAVAQDNLKQVIAEAKEAEFGKRDVDAMKKIAKLRKDDNRGVAQEQLAALERIGKAVGFDLFDWADAGRPVS